MDRLTVLCLLRELLTYPGEDLFDLMETGVLGTVLSKTEGDSGSPPCEPVSWTSKPASLEEWQALYLSTFEVGVPAPKSPVQESFYVDSASASQVIRENYLFYKHFGYPLADDPAPHDSLPKQLGFLAYLEAIGQDPGTSTAEQESSRRAHDDYLDRHLRPWLPKLVDRAKSKGVDPFYLRILSTLDRLVAARA